MSSHSFEICVEGDLEALAGLADIALVESVEHEVTTVLSASFHDMDELSATLRRLRAYGLEVIEIRRVSGVAESGAAERFVVSGPGRESEGRG